MDKVFAIVGNLKREPDTFMMCGTGFFIDDNGFFTTAGHVFREHRNSIQQFFICFPFCNEQVDLFPVVEFRFYSRRLYLDNERSHIVSRKRYDYQCGPEYFDVAVGKADLSETPFYHFKKKRPFVWDELKMPCYNANKTICPKNRFSLVNGKLESQYIEQHNWGLILKERLALTRIPFLHEGMEFKSIDLYNNCIEVYGNGTRGNSGAPIIDSNGKVIGIYVSGTVFNDLRAVHLSRYVKKKSNILKKIICNET